VIHVRLGPIQYRHRFGTTSVLAAGAMATDNHLGLAAGSDVSRRNTPMAPRVFDRILDLEEYIGCELSVSDWMEVTQERIMIFADATEDRQWIHVDPARAARESPWRSTIAHGFLTVGLLSPLLHSALTVKEMAKSINYGFNRLRFPAPVVTGSRIRARFTLAAYETIEGGARVTWSVVVECLGAVKPVLVGEWLMHCVR
jgi:acyl dehydratase